MQRRLACKLKPVCVCSERKYVADCKCACSQDGFVNGVSDHEYVCEPEHVFACMRERAWLFPWASCDVRYLCASLCACACACMCAHVCACVWFCERVHVCLCVCRRPSAGQAHRDTLSVIWAQVRFTPPVTGDLTRPHQVCFHMCRKQKEAKEALWVNKPRSVWENSQSEFICVAFHRSDSLCGLHRLETKMASEVNKKSQKNL